jgi:Arc/MetJ-type ribon-helix-helix transcriptional regulator
MKTASLPSIRVEPELRSELESVLQEGESLSEFVEASVRASVQRRRLQSEFVARGLRSLDEARRTGDYADAGAVLEKLQSKLDAASTSRQKSRK